MIYLVKDMIYPVYDVPMFPHSAEIGVLGQNEGDHIPKTLQRAEKHRKKRKICPTKTLRIGPTYPLILQKEASLTKKRNL